MAHAIEKNRVFIYARKRGVGPGAVRRLFRILGHSTLADSPEVRKTGILLKPDWNGNQVEVPYTYRDPMDYRKIPEEVLSVARKAVDILADGKEPLFVAENSGFLSWECSEEDFSAFGSPLVAVEPACVTL